MQAFGVTEDQMDKATAMLDEEQIHQKLGKFVSLTSQETKKTEEVSNNTMEKESVRNKHR